MNLMSKAFQRILEQQARKRAAAHKLSSLSVNDLAKQIRRSGDDFLYSAEWRALRKNVLDRYGYKCMCCGAEPKDLRKINVDHIKPRRHFPDLALDEENLQVLCSNCNKKKGNRHHTDYRPMPYLQVVCSEYPAA